MYVVSETVGLEETGKFRHPRAATAVTNFNQASASFCGRPTINLTDTI